MSALQTPALELRRLGIDDAGALRRYFNESESVYAGLRSTFGAQAERAAQVQKHVPKSCRALTEKGGPCTCQIEAGPWMRASDSTGFVDTWAMHEEIVDRIDSMRERSRIAARLELAGQEHARALERTYSVELWSGDRAYVDVHFGPLAAIAVHLSGRYAPSVPRTGPPSDRTWLRAEFGPRRLMSGSRAWAQGRVVAAAQDIDRGEELDMTWLVGACRQAACGQLTPTNRRALLALMRDADVLLGLASAAYLLAKARVPEPS